MERLQELEKKREEFRRKIDEKRARMAQMTEAERDDFLFKLRYLRPDAADPEESFTNGSQGTKDGFPGREENDGGSGGKKPRMEDMGDANENTKQNARERERQAAKEKIILEEMQREEKMKRAFFDEQLHGSGSGWESGQHVNKGFRDPFMGGTDKGQTSGDPFSSGINREDPGDMGSYANAWEQGKGGKRVKKAWQGWKDPGARVNGDQMHSVKHGIERRRPFEKSFGEVLVIAIIISFVALNYVEYSN